MDVSNVISYLKNSNKRLEETLIDGFINDNTIKYLPIYVLETFALNKEAQLIIMNLSLNHLKNISKIINYTSNMNQDWISICAKYYHFINNEKYTNLVNEINDKELDYQYLRNLLFIINNSRNYFNINSIYELINLSDVRNNKNNQNSETNDPNILLLNKYGISYDNAYNLYLRYGKDVLRLPESKEKNFLLDIKNIIEGKGTQKIVFDDIDFIINIDSILRNFYSKIYNNIFYNPTIDKKIGSYDNVDIYDAGLDFNMCIYSYGLATEYQVPENFKKDWNRPSISTDYMCNSIINSCSIKTHVKHCLFGFSKFQDNDLSLLGANDLGTGGIYQNLNVTNPFYQKQLIADVEFRIPDELINNTRFTNNEVYRSRRRIVNEKLERINPDYIVYLKREDNFYDDLIWKESLQAAKDFSIPIVIIDCEKCLIHNVDKIEKQLELFESRYDNPEIIKTIIESIYAISSGYKDISLELLEKHFSLDKKLSFIMRISKHIDEIANFAPKTALESIKIVLDTIDLEDAKVLKSPYWVNKAKEKGYKVGKPIDIITYFEGKQKELEKILNENNVNKLNI